MDCAYTDPAPRVASLAQLIEAEFDEMPGMRLTLAQVRRLWNLSQPDCEQALEYLCGAGRLACDRMGRYFRSEPGGCLADRLGKFPTAGK